MFRRLSLLEFLLQHLWDRLWYERIQKRCPIFRATKAIFKFTQSRRSTALDRPDVVLQRTVEYIFHSGFRQGIRKWEQCTKIIKVSDKEM
jgi:hypothetical protein